MADGRFAMFAAIGIISADLYTGKDNIERFGLATTGTMKSSNSRGLSFAGLSFDVRAQHAAVSGHAYNVSTAEATERLGFYFPCASTRATMPLLKTSVLQGPSAGVYR